MRVETTIFAALLTGTLGLSWLTYKSDGPADREEVAIYSAPKAVGITEVRWAKGDERTVVKVVGKEGDDVRTRIVTTHREEAEAHDPHDPHDHGEAPKGDGAPEGEPVTRAFPGSARAARALDALNPFMALRRFDAPTETALDEMGLSDPKETLDLVSGDKVVHFDLGDAAYGSENLYLKDEAGVAWLVSSSAVRALRRPEQSLMERQALVLDSTEVVGARWAGGGEAVDLVHQGRHDKDGAFYAFADRPDERDASLDGLAEQVANLRITEWPTEAETPEEADLPIVAEAVFVGEDFRGELGGLPPAARLLAKPDALRAAGILGVLQVARRVTETGEVRWYVRTDHTGAWALMDTAAGGDLSTMLEDVLGR